MLYMQLATANFVVENAVEGQVVYVDCVYNVSLPAEQSHLRASLQLGQLVKENVLACSGCGRRWLTCRHAPFMGSLVLLN